MLAYHYILSGQVQGVGFRPYVYRLANQHQLTGWVKNTLGQVEIRVQGNSEQLQSFNLQLIEKSPPLAQPTILSYHSCPLEKLTEFNILTSEVNAESQIHVPPDYFTCDQCLSELHNPQDRRYHYPFINCTQCGPRYTLIQRLPYDRPNTSMANFPLCNNCLTEYLQPTDRRFHAQPLACPDCGPQLTFRTNTQQINDTQQAISACIQAVKNGKIIAIKGIGGYHLICAADNDTAILRLRAKKPRPAKPLAIMLAEIVLTNDAMVHQLLHTPERPIVLINKQYLPYLSSQISPGLNEIGVMLPYSPLHHLLLTGLGKPIVATSANLSGEPVLTENQAVEQYLSHVADGFLHHNRPIIRPADDSVFKIIAQQPRPIRLGRGHAPLELSLPFRLSQPTLAIGAFLKNTIALAWQDRIVISPHIGDLGSVRSLDVFTQVINDLQQLYHIQAKQIVCDAHPNYSHTHWAKRTGLPVKSVYHHYAHASAIAGEFPQTGAWLIFTWDGVGFGANGQLWGGETLYGQPRQWQRLAHLRPFRLPGGDKASRELWRSALAVCWEIGLDYQIDGIAEIDLLKQAWLHQLNSPLTTSIGRLFDAMAALSGVLTVASFEGQGAMLLEALCLKDYHDFIALPLYKNTAWETDWSPLIEIMLSNQMNHAEKATFFHNTLAHAILQQVLQISQEKSIGQIGLSGGVFQNRYLTEYVINLLTKHHFNVYLPQKMPCNDAAISFGQIIEMGNLCID